jgi:uncharacterized membrane protein
MKKRMISALIGGAILGLVCVVGAYLRSGGSASPGLIFSLWYNRVIMGLVIGAPWVAAGWKTTLLRGALFGLAVSFAYYSATGFSDHISFIAGIVYGVLLEAFLLRFTEKVNKP